MLGCGPENAAFLKKIKNNEINNDNDKNNKNKLTYSICSALPYKLAIKHAGLVDARGWRQTTGSFCAYTYVRYMYIKRSLNQDRFARLGAVAVAARDYVMRKTYDRSRFGRSRRLPRDTFMHLGQSSRPNLSLRVHRARRQRTHLTARRNVLS